MSGKPVILLIFLNNAGYLFEDKPLYSILAYVFDVNFLLFTFWEGQYKKSNAITILLGLASLQVILHSLRRVNMNLDVPCVTHCTQLWRCHFLDVNPHKSLSGVQLAGGTWQTYWLMWLDWDAVCWLATIPYHCMTSWQGISVLGYRMPDGIHMFWLIWDV